MKIFVLAANGKAGKLIVSEALSRNHNVTAIIRSDFHDTTVNFIKKDILDLTYDDLKDADVIISALGVWKNPQQHSEVAKHLIDILSGKPNRIIFVGGTGSMYIDQEHTLQLVDTPDFPDEYKPVANAMRDAFNLIKQSNDVNWSYLSPAAEFIADGERTGKFIIGNEVFFTNNKGESKISYADYAIAIIDEAEKNEHNKKRFSVIGE